MKQIAIPIPVDGLNIEVWERWVEYRKAIRKKIKPASELAAQRRLASFNGDQAAVVEQSIANGWQGLFPLNGRNGSGKKSVGDYRADLEQKIADAEWEEIRVIHMD